jgi:group I intron endonuclease
MIYYIYKITNLCNGKIYIGIHKTQSLDDDYLGSGKLLKAAIKKYGKDNFKKEVLETFNNEADMVAKEQELVTAQFVLDENNYNIMPGGKFGSLERNGLSFKNKKHSLETIEKIRNAAIGKTHSDATRKKLSDNNFSKTDPEKQKEHARQAGSYSKSDEHKLKISESMKKVHQEINPNLGKIRQKVKCPHCGKEGANNTMSRWHFNNCSVGG